MLLLTAQETGRVFDSDRTLILWGLGIKAKIVNAAKGYRYADQIVEIHSRIGTNDCDCEYFFIGLDGYGCPVRPEFLERVPDDTPTTINYSEQVKEFIEKRKDEGIQRAKYLVEYQAYVQDFAQRHARGEKPNWNPPSPAYRR